MGLGKTFIGGEKLWQLNNVTNLVICQKSKIDDWVQHFIDGYSDDYDVYDLTDKKQANQFQADMVQGRDVIGVINYELAFRRSYINQIKDFTLMLDESSLITNENAKRSKFILKLHPESVILLSGTPTAGKYEKLWSQVRLLGWNITKKAFYASYVVTEWIDVDGFNKEIITGYKNVNHLKRRLGKLGAVFLKTEEVMDLPEQIEQYLYVKSTKEYRYFSKHSYLLLDDVELVGDNTLTKILHQRQLCGQYHKAKLDAFVDLVESTEDRLIVFYNFTAELEQMMVLVDRPTSVLNGKTKDLTAYNKCGNSITFIQYQAGAMGRNFQLANKIIYFTLPLGKGSCDLWEQSKKRIHRIGQEKACFYYYLLVKGTIEEKNLEALKEGRDLTNELFKEY